MPISGLDVRSCGNEAARPCSSKKLYLFVRSEARKATIANISLFWNVTPCTIVDVYRRFLQTWRLHLQCNLQMEAACFSEMSEISTKQNGVMASSVFFALSFTRWRTRESTILGPPVEGWIYPSSLVWWIQGEKTLWRIKYAVIKLVHRKLLESSLNKEKKTVLCSFSSGDL